MNGVLIVDKTAGITSHDVVRRARRAIGTRAVGHAGTLDPMATGVLVLAVGEATKLVAHLTAADKEYEAEVTLGAETDSLDSDGSVIKTAEIPTEMSDSGLRRILAGLEGEQLQRAPKVSAIKVGGRALHARVRRGEEVEAPLRRVRLDQLELLSMDLPRIRLHVRCGKGFYVRSLARDLASALGTVGHLSALRRTRSGSFGLEAAVPFDRLERAAGGDGSALEALRSSLRSLEEAVRELPSTRLTETGAAHAFHGRPVRGDDLIGGLPSCTEDATVALLDREGWLVALGRREGDHLRVVRGIRR